MMFTFFKVVFLIAIQKNELLIDFNLLVYCIPTNDQKVVMSHVRPEHTEGESFRGIICKKNFFNMIVRRFETNRADKVQTKVTDRSDTEDRQNVTTEVTKNRRGRIFNTQTITQV